MQHSMAVSNSKIFINVTFLKRAESGDLTTVAKDNGVVGGYLGCMADNRNK